MKRTIQAKVLMLFLFSAILLSHLTIVQAAGIQPRYTGIFQLRSTLNISTNGAASCTGKVSLRNGYTADVTVELKQDGRTIKTWTKSGEEVVSAGGTYYVVSGHDYVVTTTASVYDEDGALVESPSLDSVERHY